MVSKSTPVSTETRLSAERHPIREQMRPARGLLVGLTLSAIIWLGVLVVWLAI